MEKPYGDAESSVRNGGEPNYILIALAGLTIEVGDVKDITMELLFVVHFFHL